MDMKWLSDLLSGFMVKLIEEAKQLFPISPFRTLRIARVNRDLACWWHDAKQLDGKVLMQISGDFLVTNLTNDKVVFSRALINKKKKFEGTVLAGGLNGRPATGFLPPRQCLECRLQFMISPLLTNSGDAYMDDIAIVDNFGNEHWFKKCRFDYMR